MTECGGLGSGGVSGLKKVSTTANGLITAFVYIKVVEQFGILSQYYLMHRSANQFLKI